MTLRPTHHSTGLSNLASELVGKRLEQLKQTVPGVSRVAVLWQPDELDERTEKDYLKVAEVAARSLARIFHTETRNEVGRIITSHVKSGVETDRCGDSADAKLYRDPSAICEARTARN
jgi:ABC-type uncharacterized transport system substrate-binding protein